MLLFRGVALRVLRYKIALILWTILAFEIEAKGATVVYVGRTYAVIDAGKENGLSKNDKVCFAEREINLVACGEVGAIRRLLAGVRLTEADAAKLAVGMKVLSENLKESPHVSKPTKKEIAKFVKALKKADQAKATNVDVDSFEPMVEKTSRRGVLLTYLGTPITPFRFHVPAYDLNREIARSDALWIADRAVTTSLMGAQVTWNAPLDLSWSWNIGGHYRLFPEDRLTVNYDARNPQVGARSITNVTSVGLFLGAARWWGPLDGIGYRVGGGLDSDISQVTYSLKTVDTDETLTIASLSSRLVVLAVRVDGGLQVPLGPVVLDFGVSALLPVFGTAQSKVSLPGLRDSAAQEQKDSAQADLKAALSHEKSGFGVQAAFGIGADF